MTWNTFQSINGMHRIYSCNFDTVLSALKQLIVRVPMTSRYQVTSFTLIINIFIVGKHCKVSPPPLQIITLAGIRWLDVQVVECISVLKYLIITKIWVVISCENPWHCLGLIYVINWKRITYEDIFPYSDIARQSSPKQGLQTLPPPPNPQPV